jgi:hypothetical protein
VANEAKELAGPVVESFVSSGRVLGYVAVGAGLVLVVGALLAGAASELGLVLLGVVMDLLAWVVLLRPVVVAHANGVVLRNMVRDIFIPWSAVQRAKVLQTLQVVTPAKTYHGLGVSRSARSMMKESRPARPSSGFLGVGGTSSFGRSYPDEALRSAAHREGLSYQSYIESRLQVLASDRAGASTGKPVVTWAALPLAALALAAGCVLLLLL